MTDLNIALTADNLQFTSDLLDDPEGLYPAVAVRLFTDRRAGAEHLRDWHPNTDRRGWWADCLLSGDARYGSLLWTLNRQKITDELLRKVEDYAGDALNDLKTMGVAQKITCTAVAIGDAQNSNGRVGLTIEIILINGETRRLGLQL